MTYQDFHPIAENWHGVADAVLMTRRHEETDTSQRASEVLEWVLNSLDGPDIDEAFYNALDARLSDYILEHQGEYAWIDDEHEQSTRYCPINTASIEWQHALNIRLPYYHSTAPGKVLSRNEVEAEALLTAIIKPILPKQAAYLAKQIIEKFYKFVERQNENF
jgi:hypothetical protein